MKIRCSLALGNKKETINKVYKHIDDLVYSWQQEVHYCQENKIKLVYNSNDRSFSNLICNFDEEKGLWKTLQSMRNVEDSALVKLLKGVK